MALTPAQIHAAADQIAAGGGHPTMQTVRAALGSGSYSTIGPALHDWRAQRQQQAAAAPVAGEPVPAQVAEQASALAAHTWAAALALADGRLAAERAALEQVRAEIEAERGEAAATADALQAALEQVQAELAQARQQHQAEQQQAAQVQEQVRAELEQARLAAARLAGQIEAEQRQIAALLARLEPVATTHADTGASS